MCPAHTWDRTRDLPVRAVRAASGGVHICVNDDCHGELGGETLCYCFDSILLSFFRFGTGTGYASYCSAKTAIFTQTRRHRLQIYENIFHPHQFQNSNLWSMNQKMIL